MSTVPWKDLSWAVWMLLALLAAAFVLGTLYICVSRPRRGLLLCVLVLPIYATSESLLKALANVFGTSQTLIPADVLVVLVLGGFLLTRRAARVIGNPRRYPVSLGLFTFLVAGLLSLSKSGSVPRSVMELLAYCGLLMLTFIVEAVPSNPQDLRRIVRYWMYSYAVVSGVGVIGLVSLAANWDTFAVHDLQQIRATFRFPNQFSLYLTATLPLVFSLLLSKELSRRARRLLGSSLPLALVLLWFSGSRSGMASVGVAAAMLGALHLSKLRVYAWAAIVLLILAVSYDISLHASSEGLQISNVRYNAVWESLTGSGPPVLELSFYEDTNSTAMDAFQESPIVGGGIGAVLNRDIQVDQPLEAHNIFFGVLGETGLLGISACILTIGMAVRNLLRARKLARTGFVKEMANGAIAALAGCFIHGLANFDWRARHLWLLLAITSVVRMAAEQEWAVARRPEGILRSAEPFLRSPAIAAASLRFS